MNPLNPKGWRISFFIKIHKDLQKIIEDKVLWNAVEELEKRVLVFE